MYTELTIGNGRTIFRKTLISDINSVNHWSFIDEFIDSNPKLSKASNSGYIYFLKASHELISEQPECFVGKEVIGFCDDEFLSDFDLNSMDLDSSRVFSYRYSGNLSVDSIFEREAKIREDEDYSDMWRVSVSGDSEQLVKLEFWKS